MDRIERLCAWYESQCKDEWQEEYGISITSLDNPGWRVTVDLTRTSLENAVFEDIEKENSTTDWCFIKKQGKVFEAFGGVFNLAEILDIFLIWSENKDVT
ncbi:immunity 53 family protein [Methylobacterium sp. GC_Met_2]|uniref:immunity 53 family protein n=1 Tax=Methylobacterium sp. GC_Met_2 TaxID=2937376 RepID=UPI00226B6FC7|nr:immunity 53 family protein [Methylobacterium sp. GC_Met_2]